MTQVAAGNGGSISLGRGNYEMSMRFDIPRAQVVAWTLRCPGIERTGVTGETFENYRTRRLAELQRMVEQDRRGLAAVTNAIAGQATARVQVQGPGTTVRADAQAPSGEVVAEQAIEQIHELPLGDVGAGSYTARANVQTFEDGACTVTTQALDPIGGSLAVDRIRDLRAEDQERQVAQRANAIDARVKVRARLVASGADEQARERRLAEQARQVEAERLRRAELETKAAAERDARHEAERVARVKREEENRIRLETEARLTWEAEAPERARLALLEKERRIRDAAEDAKRRERLAIVERERRERELVIEREARERIAIEEKEKRERLVIVETERIERIRITETERRERLLIIERQRTVALTVRGEYVAWLVGTCGADPHRYARIQRERIVRERRIEIEITERERRIEIERIERERRIEIERERVVSERQGRDRLAAIEDERFERERRELAQRHQQSAFAVRAQLSGYLVGSGARLRPPRPAAVAELAGTAPFDGARWESGTWIWIQGEWHWQWRKGGWVDSVQFGAAGGETVVRTHTPAPAVRETTTTTTTTTTATATPTSTTSTTVDVSIPTGVSISVPGVSIDVTPAPPRNRRRTAPKTEEQVPRVRDHRHRR